MSVLTPEEINKELALVGLKIVELKNEIEWVEGAYLPKQEVYEQHCQSIDFHASELKFHPQKLDIFEVHGKKAPYGGSTSNLGPLLCSLFGDALKENIKKLIDENDYEEGPGAAERPELVKEMQLRLLELEQRQEELIVMADQIGIHINRPQGFDPAVVLGFSSQ